MDFAIVKGVEKSLDEDRPLEGKSSDQKIESHPTEAVALQEGHQEAEAEENHDVDVLEACRGRRGQVSRRKALGSPGLTVKLLPDFLLSFTSPAGLQGCNGAGRSCMIGFKK